MEDISHRHRAANPTALLRPTGHRPPIAVPGSDPAFADRRNHLERTVAGDVGERRRAMPRPVRHEHHRIADVMILQNVGGNAKRRVFRDDGRAPFAHRHSARDDDGNDKGRDCAHQRPARELADTRSIREDGFDAAEKRAARENESR